MLNTQIEIPKEYCIRNAISNPEWSDWVCHIGHPYGLILRVQKGNEPNWFQRKMQKWLLDFVWEKQK